MVTKFLDQACIKQHNPAICDLRLRTEEWYCSASLVLCDFKNKTGCTYKYPHICEEMIFIDLYKSIKRIEQTTGKLMFVGRKRER